MLISHLRGFAMPDSFFLGIDGGGTSCRARIRLLRWKGGDACRTH